MATDVVTSPEAIARQFADAIRDEPAVEQLWLVSDPDGMELIAITSDVDAETERRIFGLFGDLNRAAPESWSLPTFAQPTLLC